MVCLLITLSKMNKLRDLPLMNTTMKLAVTFNFLNLGGIPPLIGFSVKLMVLKNIAILGVNVSIILVLLSVMILYIYICTSYQSFTFSPESLPMVSNPTSGGIGILVVILILRFRIFT
jgi:NADH:ubiquinone oxidoreductase subunit 2 (subunit N)